MLMVVEEEPAHYQTGHITPHTFKQATPGAQQASLSFNHLRDDFSVLSEITSVSLFYGEKS